MTYTTSQHTGTKITSYNITSWDGLCLHLSLEAAHLKPADVNVAGTKISHLSFLDRLKFTK